MEENNFNLTNKFDKDYKPFYTMNPITAAFIALIGIFILYQVGGAILTVLIFGFNFENADINAMRLLTMGGQILLLLLPTLIFARAVYPNDVTPVLRVKFPSFKEVVFFVIGLILLLPLLQSYLMIQNYLLEHLANIFPLLKKLMQLLDQMDKLVEGTYTKLLKAHSIFESSFVIFLVAVVPAICEEILFRGFVQKSFELKYKTYTSIFITSLFFGLYHFNPYGLVALIALGFYFGYAVYKSNSIVVSMVLHFTNNFITVIAFLIFGSEEIMSSSAKSEGSIFPTIIMFILFLFMFFTFVLYMNKNYNQLFKKNES